MSARPSTQLDRPSLETRQLCSESVPELPDGICDHNHGDKENQDLERVDVERKWLAHHPGLQFQFSGLYEVTHEQDQEREDEEGDLN